MKNEATTTISCSDLIKFFSFIIKLKNIKRSGWISKVQVAEPESIADHTFSVCAISMILSDILGLDTEKIMRIAILHDLAESIVGDIMPDEMPKNEKLEKEKQAIKYVLSFLPKKNRDHYRSILNEFYSHRSIASEFVHNVDKFEMIMQGMQYYKTGYDFELIRPFIESAIKFIKKKKTIKDDDLSNSNKMIFDLIKILKST